MAIILAGTNHKTSPLWLREKAALSGVRLFDARKRLQRAIQVDEVVVVTTCNRVEFYVAGGDDDLVVRDLRDFLKAEYEIDDEQVNRYFYFKRNGDAVGHLFMVSAGADSMVVGECQVAGQVCRSFAQAREEGTLGPETEKLARAASLVAERVKAETGFGQSPVSIASVAVEMARERLGGLKNKATMILGAGEMGILTARSLSAHGVATILVVNRTLSRAQDVAHHLGGRAVDYTELESQIGKVDVLVTSTSAPHVLVRKKTIEKVMASRPGRRLFIIDLAIPRNVDPEVAQVENVSLANVDDLREISQRNTRERVAELTKVNAIIEEEARRFTKEDRPQVMTLFDLPLG